jgi:hypothetical protein
MTKKLSILTVAALIAVFALIGCTTADNSGGAGTAETTGDASQTANAATGDYDAGEGYYADKIAVPVAESTGQGLGVGQIPHLVNEDYPDCLSCHNDDNYMVVMEDHASYTDDMCLNSACHAPMDKEVKEFDGRPRSEREAEAAANQ